MHIAEQLLLERNRRCGNSYWHVERLAIEQERDQVGVGLSYTHTGLNGQVVALYDSIYNLAGHFLLAFADLKTIFLRVIKKDVKDLAPNLAQQPLAFLFLELG